MIISVHLAKTAGTSFGNLLEGHFGDRLLRDSSDKPMHRPAYERLARAALDNIRFPFRWVDYERIDCIHGHFLPAKYHVLGMIRGARFITWMRDPVERLISHWHFVRRRVPDDKVYRIAQRMLDEDWSIERLCLGPELRNYYSRLFRGFPVRRFEFIGIAEHFDEDLAEFARRFLGVPLTMVHENANPQRDDGRYPMDPDLRRRVERYHASDVALYREALRLREARIGGMKSASSNHFPSSSSS
jgi:hypothetical protein